MNVCYLSYLIYSIFYYSSLNRYSVSLFINKDNNISRSYVPKLKDGNNFLGVTISGVKPMGKGKWGRLAGKVNAIWCIPELATTSWEDTGICEIKWVIFKHVLYYLDHCGEGREIHLSGRTPYVLSLIGQNLP